MSDSWSGYQRDRTTPPSVKRAERLSRLFISLGGYGTIIAVVTIFVFLLWMVLPLFAAGTMSAPQTVAWTPAPAETPAPIVRMGLDDQNLLTWMLQEDGVLTVRRHASGELVSRTPLFEGAAPTAWAFAPSSDTVAVGFDDGTVRTGRIRFLTKFFEFGELTTHDWQQVKVNEPVAHPNGVAVRTPGRQVRVTSVEQSFIDPAQVSEGSIDALDVGGDEADGYRYVVLSGEELLVLRESVAENLMTGEMVREFSRAVLPYSARSTAVTNVFLSGTGNGVLVLHANGQADRFDIRLGAEPSRVETVRLLPGGARVTAAAYMLGKTSLLIGDSDGNVHVWFPSLAKEVARAGGATEWREVIAADGLVMQRGHVLSSSEGRVTHLAGSRRSRLLAIGHESGTVRVLQVTSEEVIGEVGLGIPNAIRALALSPKENEVIAATDDACHRFSLDVAHPEATMASLFLPVRYEGSPSESHVWQSTGGTDEFEPKLGMWPLVFGTLKATFYCMLIAIPIALLAAIYTSEFLPPASRAPIKSIIEMMAGLPSVVLGFLAALVIAPFVQDRVAPTIMAFLTVPAALVLGARVWQFLPTRTALQLNGLAKVLCLLVTLGVGIVLASILGPWVENMWFGGDLKGWLGGNEGSGIPGTTLLLLPLAVGAVALFVALSLGPRIADLTRRWSTRACATLDIIRLFAVLGLGVLLALLIATLAHSTGFDPRGGFLGSYAARNALIVGFVMGFAVIPIIYTLAEDALSSVPKQLKEGSLGTGASQWQTAWRIVIPTAMSGIFSACMVGLGRAVGETMIVLMAAGNSPILEMNLFSGFRTLAANIAVEMPEAVRGSTHYRTLFLAAFVLFLMTFAINTVAELVRRAFRKRAAQL